MIRMCAPMARIEPDNRSHGSRSHGSARAAVAVLDLLGLPVAVLGRDAWIIAVNSRFERLIPVPRRDGRKQLQVPNVGANAQLGDVLARMSSRRERHGVRLIPVAATAGQPAMILHVVPVHDHDLLPDAIAIVLALPLSPKRIPSSSVLQGLFDLTPAEARVARGVAQRQTVDRIATGLGLSQETVRTQLKAVLAKTGARRNIDLAVVLAGATLPFASDDA